MIQDFITPPVSPSSLPPSKKEERVSSSGLSSPLPWQNESHSVLLPIQHHCPPWVLRSLAENHMRKDDMTDMSRSKVPLSAYWMWSVLMSLLCSGQLAWTHVQTHRLLSDSRTVVLGNMHIILYVIQCLKIISDSSIKYQMMLASSVVLFQLEMTIKTRLCCFPLITWRVWWTSRWLQIVHQKTEMFQEIGHLMCSSFNPRSD